MVRVDGSAGSNSLIKVRGLDKTYQRGGGEIHVLQGLNLDVDKSDFVAFMGPVASFTAVRTEVLDSFAVTPFRVVDASIAVITVVGFC